MSEDPVAVQGRRLHPLGLIVSVVTRAPQLIFPLGAALYGTRGSGISAPAIVALVLVASVGFRWLAWLRFRYFLGADEVRIEKGLLSRSARSIPYDRIQDVSIEQRPVARLFGLAEVKFETGGGKGDEAKLSFVSLAEAGALRETVRARKGTAAVATDAEEAEIVPVFAMDTRRLVTLGFYSFSLVIFAVLASAAQQLDFLLPFDVWDFKLWIGLAEHQGVDLVHVARWAQVAGALLALAALVLLGIASGIVRAFLTEWGFRLERTPKGFRRRRGLLTRTDVVMPVERVQAAILATGPVRARRGWHALRFVSLASDGKRESHHMVAPLAQLGEIAPILAEAGLRLPDADLPFARSPTGPWRDLWLIGTLLLAGGVGIVWLAAGVVAWWGLLLALPLALALWLNWRHRAEAHDATQLFARHGWWNRKLDLARQVNVQSVTLLQGPLLRRHRLARLEFGIAGGTLGFAALPLEVAHAIREQVLALAAPVDFSQLGLAAGD